MKLAKRICPQCGGQMNIKYGISQIKCEYCGSVIYVESEIDVADKESIRYELAQELSDKIYSLIKPWEEFQKLKICEENLQKELEKMQKYNQFVSSPVGEKMHYIVIGIIMFFALVLAISNGNVGELVAGAILSAGVYVFYLMKYKNIPDETAKMKAEYEEMLDRIKRINNENDFDIVPVDYRNNDAMFFFCKALKNRRAYTIQEAVNLYEDELHKQHITDLYEKHHGDQNSQSNELQKTFRREVENVSFDDALSVGSIVAAGITIAKITKHIKNNFD